MQSPFIASETCEAVAKKYLLLSEIIVAVPRKIESDPNLSCTPTTMLEISSTVKLFWEKRFSPEERNIDKMNSLDMVIRMAKEKSEGYTFSLTSIVLQFNDLIIATLSFLSYMLLYIARYLTVAMYHFFWTFFLISAPLLLLFNLFEGTQNITKNLFKGMIEVACWKIMWSILGAMLFALSFGDAYQAEGSYLTLIVMNFVIACAMLMTPMMVKSIVGSGIQSMSSSIGAAAVAAMAAAPAKAMTVAKTSRGAISAAGNYVHSKFENYQNKRASEKNYYSQYENNKRN